MEITGIDPYSVEFPEKKKAWEENPVEKNNGINYRITSKKLSKN